MKSIFFLGVLSTLAMTVQASAKTIICTNEKMEVLISLKNDANSKNLKDAAKVIVNNNYTRDVRDRAEGGRVITALSQSKDKRSFGLMTQTKAMIPTGETDPFSEPRMGYVHQNKHLWGLIPEKDGYETMSIGYNSRAGKAFFKTGTQGVTQSRDQVYLSLAGRMDSSVLDTCVETEKDLELKNYLTNDVTALYWKIAKVCAASQDRNECVNGLSSMVPDEPQKLDMINLHKQLSMKLKAEIPQADNHSDNADSSSGTQAPEGVQ